MEGKLITGIFDVPLYESTLEYYDDQSAPGFLTILPEAYELANYILAVDVGRKSRNLVRRVTLQISDLQGNSETYTAEFSGYTFTNSGLVSEFTVKNNSQDPLFLIDGKTRLAYRCK